MNLTLRLPPLLASLAAAPVSLLQHVVRTWRMCVYVCVTMCVYVCVCVESGGAQEQKHAGLCMCVLRAPGFEWSPSPHVGCCLSCALLCLHVVGVPACGGCLQPHRLRGVSACSAMGLQPMTQLPHEVNGTPCVRVGVCANPRGGGAPQVGVAGSGARLTLDRVTLVAANCRCVRVCACVCVLRVCSRVCPRVLGVHWRKRGESASKQCAVCACVCDKGKGMGAGDGRVWWGRCRPREGVIQQ